MIEIERIRKDFPILNTLINGQKIAYLDNAATSQKPREVIDAVSTFYKDYNSNIHRGVYTISERATKEFEEVRKKLKLFLNTNSEYELIFTASTTEAINLVAYSYGWQNFKAGDEILTTQMEHHSNIVPWFLIAQRCGAKVVFVRTTKDGLLDQKDLESKLNSKTKLLTLAHVSNVLGTINPAKDIVEMAHAKGVPVLLDAAQSVPHMRVSVSSIKADFVVFSSHKMLGPMGVGVLVARKDLLEEMPPFLGGGNMISEVTEERASWNVLPWKFEAGTSNVAGVIGLGAAIDYLQKVGFQDIGEHEKKLTKTAFEALSKVKGLRIVGPQNLEKRASIISFSLDNVHPHDLSTVLDTYGVAIRAGHHCTQPLHRHFDVAATSRVSFYLYNTEEEIDRLLVGINRAQEMFNF